MNDQSYSWFITTYNKTIIPSDPMNRERAVSFRRNAQPMIDAGFFLQLDLMKYDPESYSWMPTEEAL